jgi:tetratricopeptide (TPR) repeat protein
MGGYQSVAAFWKDKFDHYVTAGETYLKQGRYYRAVDAFALASIYKSDAPHAHAGRSLALFAAGEYMSSALFLSRALEIRPEYAKSKVYFAAMLRDKDKLAKRIADVEECLELCREPGSGLSGEGELAFLLGYVYYQMDRLGEAKKAIDAAYEKLPGSKAVCAIKKAVDDAAIRRTD